MPTNCMCFCTKLTLCPRQSLASPSAAWWQWCSRSNIRGPLARSRSAPALQRRQRRAVQSPGSEATTRGRNGMADVLEATLDRWFTTSFRAAGKDKAVRERLLSDDPDGWAAAWYAMGD